MKYRMQICSELDDVGCTVILTEEQMLQGVDTCAVTVLLSPTYDQVILRKSDGSGMFVFTQEDD
jgi:hypothetical protein